MIKIQIISIEGLDEDDNLLFTISRVDGTAFHLEIDTHTSQKEFTEIANAIKKSYELMQS